MASDRAPVVLTVAGSDSGGGAGIQADLKTFSAFRVFGTSAITAITAQNTTGVQHVEMLPPDLVSQQINSVLEDFDVAAIKIGMLGTAEIMAAVAEALAHFDGPVVLDPVMVATSGDMLMQTDAVDALKARLIPLAYVLTPNLPEAAVLLSKREAKSLDEMVEQSNALLALGCDHVLLKGGHLPPDGDMLNDVLSGGEETNVFKTRRIGHELSREVHGTGCTLSSAVAAGLARGVTLATAIRDGQRFVQQAIDAAMADRKGNGALPMIHAVDGFEPS